MKNIAIRAFMPAVCLVTASFTMPVFGMSWEPLQSDKPPTTDSQKNNKADLDLTANIRKAIMADKTLSMAAHNVKIISQDGKVTMRGAVNSTDEKDTVLAKARDIAGADNVTDDVKISPPKK